MKIICLSKRRPQGRDLFTRPYGRFFYLPYFLAQQGHDVTIILLSYKNEPSEYIYRDKLHWYCESVFPLIYSGGAVRYLKRIKQVIETDKPDWIIGFSDTWYGILGEYFADKYHTKVLLDAYDNYESYIEWAKPLHWLWRRACSRATAISAAGPALLDLMTVQPEGQAATVVPMAADPIFKVQDREVARTQLGLPVDIQLFGYCGSLHRRRDIDTLFSVIRRLKIEIPVGRFVISGRKQPGIIIPKEIRGYVIDLGYIADEHMPNLINAMDVLLSINKASLFGDYSYSVKLYEAMQCKVPVIATDLAGSRWILRENPECLVPEKDIKGIVAKIQALPVKQKKTYQSNTSWENSAQILNQILSE